MKPFIAWCFMIAVLFVPAKADDGLSLVEILAIIFGAGILGTVLYCCCMYYLCRCCWLVCNKDSANVTVVQQSQSTAPSAQPIIFAERNPVGMGLIQMPGCGNMGSSQVPGCGNMGSSGVGAYGNMDSNQEPECGDTIPLVPPPPYKI